MKAPKQIPCRCGRMKDRDRPLCEECVKAYSPLWSLRGTLHV